MELKKCPKCNRYSVSFDFNLGIEMCRWRDCNWVNTEHLDLPVAYTTVVTSRANHARRSASVGAEEQATA